jgi:DNA modification methylase
LEFHPNLLVKTTDIVPYSRNAREHSATQIAQIVASIREFGFTNPVLLDESNVLIAGHGRLEAARYLNMPQLPALMLPGLSDAQKAALRIADNKLALNATWDDDLLRTELADLRDVGFDLSLTGFGDEELGALFADRTDGLTDPDDVPEPPAEPITQLGDVWLLGRHRLVCGDATSEADVSLALDGVKPHLMVTDPPYGVDYDPDWRNDALQAGVGARGAPGGRAVGRVTNDERADWTDAWALSPSDVAYVWHGALHMTTVLDSLRSATYEPRSLIIWAKQQFVISRGHYHNQHEPCWYAVRNGKTAHWAGDRSQTTLWQIDKPHKSETGHSTQKPVECMKRPIENNSSPGQAVYDPFVGSGTTIIAAEMTGRTAHCIEISPTYCDTSIIRWQNFTGQQATTPDGIPYQEHAHREAVPAN